MQSRRQNKDAREAKKLEFSNFLPLIASIRCQLGADWGFYREFLEGVLDASSRGEIVTAWYEQIEPLVQKNEGARIAHEGVCFLLHEMEARALESRSRTSMPSPPLHLRSSLSNQSNVSKIPHKNMEEAVKPPTPPNSALYSTPTAMAQSKQFLNVATMNHNISHQESTNSHTANVSTSLSSAHQGSFSAPIGNEKGEISNVGPARTMSVGEGRTPGRASSETSE